jgi:two-component system chemotaxis response regulator CheY
VEHGQAHSPAVLIAERDRSVRELQEFFLARAGFSLRFADDGEAALEMARLEPPALVITEILIPKIDGLAHDLPIIVFSILAAATRAGEAGANAFLRKPLVESTFVAAVRSVLGERPHGTTEHQ